MTRQDLPFGVDRGANRLRKADHDPPRQRAPQVADAAEVEDGKRPVCADMAGTGEVEEGGKRRALPAKRVQGFELGALSEITPRWSVYAGLSHLKSRLTKGANEGAEARNVPDWSGSVWTSFLVTPAVTLSWGAQYVGERRYTDNVMVGGQNNTSSTVNGPNGVHPIYVADHEKAPSYFVQNLALWGGNNPPPLCPGGGPGRRLGWGGSSPPGGGGTAGGWGGVPSTPTLVPCLWGCRPRPRHYLRAFTR